MEQPKRTFNSKEELKKVFRKRLNLDKIEPRLKLMGGSNLDLSTGYPAGGGKRIDILCWNTYPEDNYKIKHWVVIELNTKNADCKVFGRTLSHLLALRKIEYFSKNSVIRGVILAEKIHDDLIELIHEYQAVTPEIKLLQYKRVTEDEIEIEDVSQHVPQKRPHVGTRHVDI